MIISFHLSFVEPYLSSHHHSNHTERSEENVFWGIRHPPAHPSSRPSISTSSALILLMFLFYQPPSLSPLPCLHALSGQRQLPLTRTRSKLPLPCAPCVVTHLPPQGPLPVDIRGKGPPNHVTEVLPPQSRSVPQQRTLLHHGLRSARTEVPGHRGELAGQA